MAIGAIIGGVGGVLGGAGMGSGSGYGYTDGGSESRSSGQSSSYGYSVGGGSASSYANSNAEDWSNSNSWESGGSVMRILGSEASAKDKQRAAEANEIQRKFWEMQADYNASEAQKARDFQEYMSNTAYQRAVLDLMLAGLNPILAAGGMGASTPVGAMSQTGLASAHKAQTFADQYSSSWYGGGSNSSSYGYSKSNSQSNESYGNKSENWSNSKDKSSSKSWNKSYNEYSNNVKDIMNGLFGTVSSAVGNMSKSFSK